MFVSQQSVEYRGKRMRMMVDGITPVLEHEMTFHPVRGAAFSRDAHSGSVFECHLTAAAAEFLSVELDRDTYIQVGMQRFLVRGIIPDPVEADPPFQLRVAVPYRSAQMLWGQRGDIGIMLVSWHTRSTVEAMIEALRKVLDKARAPHAYVLSSTQFTLQKRQHIVSNFILLGIVQAAFCILVASIGIVNVMLANVIQRSREFAIRIAMGAHYKDLAFIVLIESILLGTMGALLGVSGAMIVSPLLCRMFAMEIKEAAELQPQYGIEGILIPLLVCSFCGLMAGIVPALKARKLDILTVLRAE
jgi:putative ABC transport system permease protein